jgi:hypothetical protein
MTDDDAAELERLAGAAQRRVDAIVTGGWYQRSPKELVEEDNWYEETAEFFHAANPAAVLDLLAERKRMRAALEDLVEKATERHRVETDAVRDVKERFPIGCRVRRSKEGISKFNLSHRSSFTGRVVGYSYGGQAIRVIGDGKRSAQVFGACFWERIEAESKSLSAALAPEPPQ